MKCLDYVLEHSYDNSRSAQRSRCRNGKYEPQNGFAALGESDGDKFTGRETSTASYSSKKTKISQKPKNNIRTRSKNWKDHTACVCSQVGSGVPTSHSLSF